MNQNIDLLFVFAVLYLAYYVVSNVYLFICGVIFLISKFVLLPFHVFIQ